MGFFKVSTCNSLVYTCNHTHNILNWIHIDDEVKIIEFLLADKNADGIFNAVAPQIRTNRQWAQSFAAALGRPCIMFVPAFLMDFAYGFGPQICLLIITSNEQFCKA